MVLRGSAAGSAGTAPAGARAFVAAETTASDNPIQPAGIALCYHSSFAIGIRLAPSTPRNRTDLLMRTPTPLLAALVIYAWSGTAAAAVPLEAPELDLVVGEIEALIRTDASQLPHFVVREATPERIERAFVTFEFLQQHTNVKVNALALAADGTSLLTFEKPSDIVAKVAAWFSGEIAWARQKTNSESFLRLLSWGPFEDWQAEPIAFSSLWNCMPQNAWLQPGENPFQRRNDNRIALFPIAAQQSSQEEFDFGFCLNKRSGLRLGWTREEIAANEQRVRKMADAAAPLLRDKFAAFLKAEHCRGTGPDDCVLVLRLWSSLAPADAELAATIQALEEEVGLSKPLPPLRNPDARWADWKLEDGQERFDAALRQAAYLRTKLLSVLHAPQAWPSSALATTLHQLSRLRQVFATPFVHRWTFYELDYRNAPISPWRVVADAAARHPQLPTAILAELDSLGDEVDCEVFDQWFKHGGAQLQARYMLGRLRRHDGRKIRCGAVDIGWLKAQETTPHRDVLYGYLSSLGTFPESERETLVSGLTDRGRVCFDQKAMQSGGWRREVCRRWVLKREP